MKNKKSTLIWTISTLVIVGALITFLVYEGKKPGQYDTLAQCINDSGTKFYGAFWCPHCQVQKALFGKSAKLIPYVECSTPDGKGQLDVCTTAGIKGYPTWVFPDGSVESGEQDLATLAAKTNCSLQ